MAEPSRASFAPRVPMSGPGPENAICPARVLRELPSSAIKVQKTKNIGQESKTSGSRMSLDPSNHFDSAAPMQGNGLPVAAAAGTPYTLGYGMKHYLDFEKPIVELQRKLDDL